MSSPKDMYPTADRMYPTEALARLERGDWIGAEDGFLAVLSNRFAPSQVRILASVGAAQARILGRMDVRGAFAMVHSLESSDPRLQVVLALIFQTPEPGIHDRARSRKHVERARVLLEASPNPDLSALAAYAAGTMSEDLVRATTPVSRCLALELGAREDEGALGDALAAARAIDFGVCEARLHYHAGNFDEATQALVRSGAEGTWLHRVLATAQARTRHRIVRAYQPRRRAIARDNRRQSLARDVWSAVMEPTEIRAIRGAMSRAAFAKLLGVTPLTVLRWELTDDNKESRRPRAKMIDALRRLSAEGVGKAATAPDDDEEENEERQPPTSDELLVAPILERLSGEEWARAEDEMLSLLASTTLTTHAGRVLATLGLVQVQLFGRLDVRAALMTLLPILEEAERGDLPPSIAARAHVMAALVFGAPDSRYFDLGRVNVHAARADALLDRNADDLRVLLATARLSASRFLGPEAQLVLYEKHLPNIERAVSPLARFLANTLHGLANTVRGDDDTALRYGAAAIALAERLALPGIIIAAMADRTYRLLRGAYTPEMGLEIIERCRAKAKAAALPPNEPLIRLLACEIDLLCRLGRLSDAERVADEVLGLAKRGGIILHPLAMPIARLYAYRGRIGDIDQLITLLEADGAAAHRPMANVHAIQVRAALLSLNGDYAAGSELAREVLSAPETTLGVGYVLHDAHMEVAMAQVLKRDPDAADLACRHFREHLARSESVWHSAVCGRLEGFVLLQRGRFAEARQKLESTSATFQLLGDKIQSAFSRVALAALARAAGASDGQERFDSAVADLERIGAVMSPALLARGRTFSMPPAGASWRDQSMTEKLVIAVERLSVRGLSQDVLRYELRTIIAELFPGHTIVVGDDSGESVERIDDELTIGVRGALDPEQRAALRLLASMTTMVLGSVRVGREPPAVADSLLPSFIAVSPVMRQLKTELARLSRSSSTILVSGESGSGKEVVARAVHDLSARADKPYVVFNCASIPRELFESQLFGHKKGAFTGATADNPGVIRMADGGTLFLDEIGELPLDTQPKLLRFLENSEVMALGEQRARRVDVRIVAATHRDLGRFVQDGRFREDLFYRLHVVPLHVAPLRERREDIVALARSFIGRLTPPGTEAPELGMDAVIALKAHPWPGNVRELRNVIERAMAYSPIPEVLRAEHFRL